MVHLSERQISVVKLLQENVLAPIPRHVCSGLSLFDMRELGVIEKTEIPGFWGLTEFGETLDITDKSITDRPKKQRGANEFPEEPSGKDKAMMLRAWEHIPSVKPGSLLFGNRVRKGALERLSGFDRARRFIYFAYPLGFPLKQIAWVCRQEKPLWTDHNISIERKKVGLVADRYKTQWNTRYAKQRAKKSLMQTLLDEGCSPEEIEEYFAVGDVL